MPTDHVNYHLPDYVNNKLDAALRKGVEAHLRECASCRIEYEELQRTFASLQAEPPAGPPTMYFQTLLPRIRQRIEQQSHSRWFTHPLVVRVASPLAVAVVAIALLLHTPFLSHEELKETNQLKSVLGDVTSDELAQVIAEQASHQPLNALVIEVERSQNGQGQTSEGDSFGKDGEVLQMTASELMPGVATSQALTELNETEVEALLRRLVERTTL